MLSIVSDFTEQLVMRFSHRLSKDGELALQYPSLKERLKNESSRPRSAAAVR